MLFIVSSVGALTPVINNADVIGLLALTQLTGAALANTLPDL